MQNSFKNYWFSTFTTFSLHSWSSVDAVFCISSSYVRNEVDFLILKYSSLRGLNIKNEKKHQNLAFKPLLHEIQLNTWLSEIVSETLASKLWNKKKNMLLKLSETERNWIIFSTPRTTMVFLKIFDRSI